MRKVLNFLKHFEFVSEIIQVFSPLLKIRIPLQWQCPYTRRTPHTSYAPGLCVHTHTHT